MDETTRFTLVCNTARGGGGRGQHRLGRKWREGKRVKFCAPLLEGRRGYGGVREGVRGGRGEAYPLLIPSYEYMYIV